MLTSWVRTLCMLVAVLLLQVPAAAAGVEYVYDKAARLVGVVLADGSSVRYTYDAAGNIKSVERFAMGQLWLGEFTPDSGPAGTTVTLRGGGFSSTPASNSVSFNGTAATVAAATANTLTVSVPTAATTGLISVTVAGSTVTSTRSFVVGSGSNAAPTITGFTPTTGVAGTAVTLTGTRFDADKFNNLVRLNGDAAEVSTASATQLQFAVPSGATSGKFTVQTPFGMATSAADFYVPPAGVDPASIVQRARLAVGGTALAITGLAPGKAVHLLFDATAGQSLGLGITALTGTPADGSGSVSFSVKRPDGADWLPGCSAVGMSAGAGACNLSLLPQSGTYQLLVRADTAHTANFTLTLSADISAALTVNATTPTTFSTTRPGQNGRYTFSGTAGKSYSVVLSEVTIPGTWTYVTVLAPDGSQVTSGYTGPGYTPPTIDVPNLPITGTYSVFVDPYVANTGQLKLALRDTATGTLSVDGTATAVSLLSGQNGRYTFTGTLGQRLGLGISGISTTPSGGSVALSLYGPTGAQLANCAATSGDAECDFPPLPAAGTYVVQVDPAGTNAAALTLTLSNDLTGTLSINAPSPSLFSTTRPGQNGRYSFSGTAGKAYALALSDVTIAGTWTYVYVLAPDGSQVASGYAGAGYNPPTIDIPSLLSTGTYTVFVDPFQAQTGQLNLALRETAAGTLAIDGAATVATLLSGQNGRYTFSGTLGQRLGLGITALSTTPAGGSVGLTLVGPTGATVVSCGSLSGDGECDFPALPAAGTYALVVDPSGTNAATLTLTLSNDVAASLVVNAASPTSFSTTRPGQNGRYTFSGSAGSIYSLALSDVTIPGTWTYVYVLAPDGTTVASGYAGAGYNPPAIDIPALAASGTYAVFIDPFQAQTGQLKLALREEQGGSLSIDGAANVVSLLSGQNGRYVFTGSAGQRLGLGISGLSTVPAGAAVSLQLDGPTSALLVSCGSYSGNGECDFPPLPASGTYSLRVDPSGPVSAALTLTLSTDIAGTLVVDAPTPTTFATARAGQNGRYSFDGVAGRNYNLLPTDITIAGTWTTLTVLAPDGSTVGSANVGAGYTPGVLALNNVPATGAYTVVVDPFQAAVGQVNLRVVDNGSTTPAPQTPNGSIVADGAAVPLNVPAGQTHLYTFAGTAGQRLGLGLTGVATVPAGQQVRLFVKRPDNTTLLVDCGYAAGTAACVLPALPATGTYTVAVQPAAAAAMTGTLTLSNDLAATLVANGSLANFNTTRPGQNGRFTFSGSAGASMTVLWSGATIPGYWSYLRVQRPDGVEIASGMFSAASSASGAVDLPTLVMSGTYTVFIDPIGAEVGQVSVGVADRATGTVTVDGTPTAVTLAAGRNGRYAFSGTAGQRLGLALTTLATTPAGGTVYVRVIDPNGRVFHDCGSGTADFACDVAPLPRAGTYAIEVDPAGSASATATLTVSNDLAGALVANDPVSTLFSTARPGQNGRYTFSATAGQAYSLAWAEATIPGYWSYFTVLRPDGSLMSSNLFGLGQPSGSFDTGVLPATGTYTLIVNPVGVNIGQVKFQLAAPLQGSLAVDGTPTAVSLSAGQNGQFSFSGTAGQNLGLAMTGLSTVPAGGSVSLRLLDPAGALLQDCSSSSGDLACALRPLPRAGTYTVVVDPSSANSAALTLTLSSDQGGPLAVNSATGVLFSSSRPGQNGRYTFSANAGQRLSVAWAEATVVGYWSYWSVMKPDGSMLSNSNFFGVGNPTGMLDLGVLTTSGSYTLLVDPYSAATGQARWYANTTLTGTLTVDAAPTAVALAPGRMAEYSFAGTAGRNLGTILSEISSSPVAPSGDPFTIELRSPSGALLKSCKAGSVYNSSCRFPALPAAGTYKLLIHAGPNTSSFKLQIRSTI